MSESIDDEKTLDNIDRLIQINNESYYHKKKYITTLMSFIYFLLYSMFIGLFYSIGSINMNVLIGLFVFGLIILFSSYYSSSSDIFKIYRDGGEHTFNFMYSKLSNKKCDCKK